MKKTNFVLFIVLLVVFSFQAKAQTKENKFSISAGGGFENYKGDLGNTFFNSDEEVYGFFRIGLSRYLNKSFDAQFIATTGNYGHCRDKGDDLTDLNMRALLTTGIFHLKYKFANGYLLKENAKIAPYIYAGGGIDDLYNFDSYNRVNAGIYFSYNTGLGCNYNITPNIYLAYNITFGFLSSDKLDYIIKGSNDMYMQNSLSIGINLPKANIFKQQIHKHHLTEIKK